MISELINELVEYGCQNGLVVEDDRIYITNRLLEFFELTDNEEIGCGDELQRAVALRITNKEKQKVSLATILEAMMAYSLENGILSEDTQTGRDLFDTGIMGLLTPPPSVVRNEFREQYKESPKLATDYFYHLSKASNYIRTDRIIKDEKWICETEYGPIDITINLSKPEKDPRDIVKAGQAKPSGYPSCLLCKENEGYAGHFSHPARQNHRIIPVTLQNESYYMQYSPYVYYNEHCIVFHEKHIPMKINKAVFGKLLEFVEKFPHYIIGSNADLPIVGGSILSHDHFQGGRYEFAMAKAEYEYTFTMKHFEDIKTGIIKWPMSVIRLQGVNRERIAEAAEHITQCWRNYTDEDAFIYAYTEDTPHNTVTPIARRRGKLFELDLVLRNNITTEECPWGLYHPTEEYHHIKKENIGLIEVMGLAVLPSRLKREMIRLEEAILKGEDISSVDEIAKHTEWVSQWISQYDITEENIHGIVKAEIGKVFVKVLECAGVYKRDAKGMAAFHKFIAVCEE